MSNTDINSIIKQEWIDQMPGAFGAIDLKSNFLMLNQESLKRSGHKNYDSILNSTYCDMRCEAAELHDNFCLSDKMVIEDNKSIGIFGCCLYANGWKILLGEKYPLRDIGGNIIAVAQYFIDITNANLVDLARFFKITQEQPVKLTRQQFNYIIQENYPETVLSGKQSECLFFLLRGRSIKEIAKILNLSPRTVETHIEIIKYKLGCLKKSDVIEKAIALGYMNIIPKNLFKKLI